MYMFYIIRSYWILFLRSSLILDLISSKDLNESVSQVVSLGVAAAARPGLC